MYYETIGGIGFVVGGVVDHLWEKTIKNCCGKVFFKITHQQMLLSQYKIYHIIQHKILHGTKQFCNFLNISLEKRSS